MSEARGATVLADVGAVLDAVEALYKDVHRHPELSMQEERTAALAAQHLGAAGFEVTTGVGHTGVVGVLRNGDGGTVMLRADMDALPVQEQTGLDYASTIDGVMHACGHDMHVAWLAGAAAHLATHREEWRGTVLAVFQPAEETAAGAEAMIADGFFERFAKPDVILGQHVMPAPAGSIGTRSGVVTSAADSFEIRMFGRGAHGSMPQASVDPVVMAAATVLRLQTIVAREVAPAQSAVVTVGALQAGAKANVIPDEAVIKLNVRTYDEDVRKHVLDAIRRIVTAEAQASAAPRPPEITALDHYELVRNDPAATDRIRASFRSRFGPDRVADIPPLSASEDFGSFGREGHVPSVFWTVGGSDAEAYRTAQEAGRLAELPTNHNPRFAPVIHPTLRTGVETLVTATYAWLGAGANPGVPT
jgi:hippurate hydrolase